MPVLSFLTQLAGATLLLLFAVRMVRTGIERAFGTSFQRLLTADRRAINLMPVGVLLAMVLQSSAAVALLVAGFSGTGALGFTKGLAIVLGGDLGSALLIVILSLKLNWLMPVLLTLGGILFLKTERRHLKQAGRIILGIAFILIALRFLREAVDPIRDSQILPALSSYLERDFLTAFLAGTALAFVMHSSVAVILMCVALVGVGALPVMVGVSLVLGANLGSAFLPVWLTRGMDRPCRRVPFANLALRGAAAILALFLVNNAPVLDLLPPLGPGATLVALHILFNTAVLSTLALAPLLETPLTALLPEHAPLASTAPHRRSHLDQTAISTPVTALACIRREVMRMAEVLSGMLAPVMALYDTFDKDQMRSIRDEDSVINKALDDIRLYAAALPHKEMSKVQMKELRSMMDYAIALEAAGDIVVKRLLPLAEEKASNKLRFSQNGRSELESIHQQVARNLTAATNVLVSDDVESARLLLEEKAEMARLERQSRKQHLKRLSAGDADSFGSSDIHLETAYSLKELNSWIVTVAHPILVREGQLLETRLSQELPTGS